MSVEDEVSRLQRRRGQVIALGVAVFVLLGANVGALAGIGLQRVVTDGGVAAQPTAAAAPAGPVAAPDPTAVRSESARRAARKDGAAAPKNSAAPRPRRTDKPRPAPASQGQPLPTAPVEPDLPAVPVGPSLTPFSGLSTWIDVYDTGLTAEQQVDIAAAGGVQTIFVQSAKHNSKAPIHFPRRLATVIERAHDYGMRVMVWYVPDFRRIQRDFHRSTLAISFTTPRGDRADAFGLDIEVEKLRDTGLRTQRLLELSESLRQWAGPDYPMAAIVLPPLQLDLRPSWWPDFPYAGIAPYYDVFIPMSYSSFRGTDARTTFEWNLNNVLEMRRRAGNPSLPVHLAGGIADNLPRLGAFIKAAAEADVLGAGLYDLHTTSASAWPHLRRLRVDPQQP